MKILITLLLLTFSFPAFATDKAKESVYDRVMRTGTIKCGYFIEHPFVTVEPNSGKLSGIVVDTMNLIGKELGVKVEWSQEVTFAGMTQDIMNGRVDMICSSVWNVAPRNRIADYIDPFVYITVSGYVRADDARFGDNYEAIVKSGEVSIAMIDGEGSAAIAKGVFPNAKRYDLPQNADPSQLLLSVESKKADIAFAIIPVWDIYQKNNPGKLRNVSPDKPLYVVQNSFMIKRGEHDFKAVINNALKRLMAGGDVDRIIDRYEDKPGTFLRVAKPYEVLK